MQIKQIDNLLSIKYNTIKGTVWGRGGNRKIARTVMRCLFNMKL